MKLNLDIFLYLYQELNLESVPKKKKKTTEMNLEFIEPKILNPPFLAIWFCRGGLICQTFEEKSVDTWEA